MSHSKAYIAISLTRKQVRYLRQVMSQELAVGRELPAHDKSFADIHAMAESVLEALNNPMPVYVAEQLIEGASNA